jgi:Transposase DNA-binding/Transposase DDE domain
VQTGGGRDRKAGMALDQQGIAQLVHEAHASNFKDRRLRDRLATIVGKLAASPEKSFPKLFSSAELEGAYRFFGNPKVNGDEILSGHYASVAAQSSAMPSVLVVHDSTVFVFDPEGERVGLGRVRSGDQSFFGHFALALRDDGSRLPLGVAALETWVRNDDPQAPTEKSRWARGVDTSGSRLRGASPLHVMDREGDDYALLAHLVGGKHRFLIRLMHDRILEKHIGIASTRISDVLAQVECVIERAAKLSKRKDGGRSPTQRGIHPSRSARSANLAIGAVRVELPRPTARDGTLPERLGLNLVRVWEPDPPVGADPVEWVLLTTEPVDSAQALNHLVDAYRARWTIEEFFKALKTGCSFLKRQLEDYEALVNALAVSAPIAAKALELRSVARQQPDSTDIILDADHLLVLREMGRIKLRDEPTNRDILLAVAALGGHIKWNGEPGWKTICGGLETLLPLTEGFRLARKLLRASDQ